MKFRKDVQLETMSQSLQEVERTETDPEMGLTSQEALLRAENGYANVVTEDNSMTVGKIVRSNVLTYFNMIFFVMALVLLYEGSFNNLTFLIVVTVNAVIGIVQELKSKRTLDELKLVSAPEVVAIRDGEKVSLPSDQLVLDDIVIFSAGSQICADAILTQGEITVNESLVTGESDEIKKKPGDTLLSGSFVISGQGRARLDQVGDNSFAAQLSRDAKKIKKRQQPGMMRSLTLLIKVIGIIIIPFAALMFWNQYKVLGLPEKISVENTAASVIGMIPEGLYLLTSVALAASTIRLAKQDTLVHDMKCIETLARVDVLCVDKTGTITEPHMNVEQLIPLDGGTEEEAQEELSAFVSAMSSDNETMKALKEFCGGQLPRTPAVRVRGFSSATKYSAADFGQESYILGAPEILLQENTRELMAMIEEYSSKGQRVLLFASYDYERHGDEDIFEDGTLGPVVIPIGLVIFSNAIRENAKETFEFFNQQGVGIKVISGDNPVTAAKAAQQAGILGAEKYIDATTLKTPEQLQKAASEYTVFGRVTPEQKRSLVRALKKKGHTVAMTGDGVNDVLALKDADCSIAMASGSEAAANVSDLVLLNSDFSGMPHVVAEGRRVINNIQRSATLFLVKNIFSFVLSLISLVSVSLYPLKPSQISLISAFMIGTPSFFLALEPNEERVKGKFLRNVLYRALPAALTSVILVEWSLLFTEAFGIAQDQASTIAFFLYAIASYFMLFRICMPISLWHGILFGTMGVLFLGTTFLFPSWFQIAALDYHSLLILSPLLLLTLPIDQWIHAGFRKLKQWREKAVEYYENSFMGKYSRNKKTEL